MKLEGTNFFLKGIWFYKRNKVYIFMILFFSENPWRICLGRRLCTRRLTLSSTTFSRLSSRCLLRTGSPASEMTSYFSATYIRSQDLQITKNLQIQKSTRFTVKMSLSIFFSLENTLWKFAEENIFFLWSLSIRLLWKKQ